MPSPDPDLASDPIPSGLSRTRTFIARYAFSQSLARFTALSEFERSIDAFMQGVEPLSRRIYLEHPHPSWFEPASDLLRLRREYQPGYVQGQSFKDSTVSPSFSFYERNPAMKGASSYSDYSHIKYLCLSNGFTNRARSVF